MNKLITTLQSEDWESRLQAAENLGKSKDKKAIEPLIRALNDSDEYVKGKVQPGLLVKSKINGQYRLSFKP